MRNVEAVIEDGGEITLGAIDASGFAATAADGHIALAMLVRCDGETLNALLKLLDRAIALYFGTGETADQINSPSD